MEDFNNHNSNMNNSNVDEKELDENISMGGWLSFLLFSLFAGAIVSLILAITRFDVNHFSTAGYILAFFDIVTFGYYLVVSSYAVYCMIQRKGNAIFLVMSCLIFLVIINVLILLIGEVSDEGVNSTARLVRSTIWCVIWIVYLSVSNHVQEWLPTKIRQRNKVDKLLSSMLFVLPIVLLLIGSIEYAIHGDEFQSKQLTFEVPAGFTCDTIVADDIVVYQMESETDIITITSAGETEFSYQEFNSYWENWKDTELDELAYEITEDKRITLKQYDGYLRIVEYDLGVPFYWYYYFLYDDENYNVCVASVYTLDAEYLNSFLQSIQF